jgi:hypothetical protein
MEKPKFNLEDILKRIEESKRAVSPWSTVGGAYLAFPPAGKHTVRFLQDPTGTPFLVGGLHRSGKQWVPCPDFLRRSDPTGGFPICDLCLRATRDNNWAFKVEIVSVMYGYLDATAHENQFWRPRQLYAIVGNDRMRQTFTALLESLLTRNPETLAQMLDPQQAGPSILMQLQKGRLSDVTMELSPTPELPPVPLGPWYQPLAQYWSNRFTLAKYQDLCMALTRFKMP